MSQVLNEIGELLTRPDDDGTAFLTAIMPGIDALGDPELAEDAGKSWADRRAGFLTALEVSEGDWDADPLLFPVGEFVRFVDNGVAEEDKWPALPAADAENAEEQDRWINRVFWTWVRDDDTYYAWARRAGLTWVAGDDQAKLGDGWQGQVTDLLNDKYPQWWGPAATDEELAAWVTEWVPSLIGEASEEGAPVTGLAWAEDAQPEKLLRDEWRELLLFALDRYWPEWHDQTAEALAGWLADWTPSFEATRDLGWVTNEQRDQLAPLGDGWADQLRDALDDAWPQWRIETDPTVLVGFLTDWIPTLFPDLAPGGKAPSEDGAAATGAAAGWETSAEPAAKPLAEAQASVAEFGLEGLREAGELAPSVAQRLAQLLPDERDKVLGQAMAQAAETIGVAAAPSSQP